MQLQGAVVPMARPGCLSTAQLSPGYTEPGWAQRQSRAGSEGLCSGRELLLRPGSEGPVQQGLWVWKVTADDEVQIWAILYWVSF